MRVRDLNRGIAAAGGLSRGRRARLRFAVIKRETSLVKEGFMKRLTDFVLLSVLGLLAGCGGGAGGAGAGIPGSRSHGVNITGNWQLSTTSTVPGMPPTTIAGSITQSGSSVNGAVHVDGSNCFDQLTTIGLIGSLATYGQINEYVFIETPYRVVHRIVQADFLQAVEPL